MIDFRAWFKTPVQEKAVSSNSGGTTTIYPSLPVKLKPTSDPLQLMPLSRGYVAAANKKVSSTLAAIPLHLYAVVDKDFSLKMVTPSTRCDDKTIIKLKAASTSIASAMTNKKTVVELFNHPFIDLLRHPSQGWSQTEWLSVISSYLGIIGNCYLLKERNSSGQLIGLKPLQSECVRITYDVNSFSITQYTYQPLGGGALQQFSPEQILHIRNRTAGSLLVGRGDLEDCQEAFLVSNGAYAFTNALLNNMAVPSGIFSIKDDDGKSIPIPAGEDPETYLQAMRDKVYEQFGGISRGKPMVSFGKTDFVPMNVTMADTKIDTFLNTAKQEIAAAFRVPVSLLDDSQSNRATAYVASRNLIRFGVLPKLSLILDQINALIETEYDSNIYCWWNPTEASDNDPMEQEQIMAGYVGSGIMSVNEARAVLGLEALSGAEYETPKPLQGQQLQAASTSQV